MITLIGAEKGGTGKTTMAVNLAILLAKLGRNVMVVDTDQQGSASNFFQVRDEGEVQPRVPCIQKFGKNLARDVMDISKHYEEILIDAGGRDSMELRYSMGIADRLYIPLRPSQFDVWTLEGMNDLVGQAQGLNTDLEAFVVLNMASPNPCTTDAADALELISDYENLKCAKTVIIERVAFQRSIREGLSVVELGPVDRKAYNEIIKLFKEVYNDD
jgi:chromosome partitioning protein